MTLVSLNKLSELEGIIENSYRKVEDASFKFHSLDQVECYTELLDSSRLFIKVTPSSKIVWAELELSSIKQTIESNKKHLWVLANQYRNSLQNYIKLSAQACEIDKLGYGKDLLNRLTNDLGDYFTASQLEQNVKFEQLSISCITS